jgi:acyl-coenzyme A thioesterase PaaI-like protein
VAVDILRPVPVGKVTVSTRTLRPGRRVALLEAIMEADGQEVLTGLAETILSDAAGECGRALQTLLVAPR